MQLQAVEYWKNLVNTQSTDVLGTLPEITRVLKQDWWAEPKTSSYLNEDTYCTKSCIVSHGALSSNNSAQKVVFMDYMFFISQSQSNEHWRITETMSGCYVLDPDIIWIFLICLWQTSLQVRRVLQCWVSCGLEGNFT